MYVLYDTSLSLVSMMDSDLNELMALSQVSDKKIRTIENLIRQVELYGNSEELEKEERELKIRLNQYYNYLMSIMSQASQEPFEDQEEDDIQGLKSSSYAELGDDTNFDGVRIEAQDLHFCGGADNENYGSEVYAERTEAENSSLHEEVMAKQLNFPIAPQKLASAPKCSLDTCLIEKTIQEAMKHPFEVV